MVQRISFGKLGASGIVAVLFMMGIILILTGISAGLGYLCVTGAIVIAFIYAIMGAGGIARRNKWM
jgi:hypothetical protein